MGGQITPSQAAEIIGCSPQQVRTLIRGGKIKAKKIYLPYGGYVYTLTKEEAGRYASKEILYGFPRGSKRKKKRKTRKRVNGTPGATVSKVTKRGKP
jgi:hypothetical protein